MEDDGEGRELALAVGVDDGKATSVLLTLLLCVEDMVPVNVAEQDSEAVPVLETVAAWEIVGYSMACALRMPSVTQNH